MAVQFNPFTGNLDLIDTTAAAGSDTQVQFNSSGSLTGSADLTWDDTGKTLTVGGDIDLDDGGTYATTLQVITPTANRTISYPDATGTLALVAGSSGQLIYNSAGANAGTPTLTYDGSILTSSGRFINSYNATASSPAKAFTGTWFTGGTATTTKPHVLIEPAGTTTSTAWSTSGTGLGINAASGFAGNLLDLQVNGTSRFAVTATPSGGYVILKGFNHRPPMHRGPLFYKTAATTISVSAGSTLNGVYYPSATAVTMPGSHADNTDYAIWQHPTTGALVADASFTTAPAGATGGSIVGGYHYIPAGRPTAINAGSPTANPEILEFSIWDLTWRPSCPDPRGMSCIDGRFWIDLYLCGATSYAGTTFSAVPSSKIGLTIADGSSPPLIPAVYGGNGSTVYSTVDSNAPGSWWNFSEVATSFGKRLPSWFEFSAAAFGAPENGSRGSDPGTVIWERVSRWGLAQATGTLWVWGAEVRSLTGGAWTSATGDRGDVYQSGYSAVRLGGDWGAGSLSGSRAAFWDSVPTFSGSVLGGRFAAGHLISS